MKKYGEIRKFLGKSITDEDLEYFDCCCSGSFGLMIPVKTPNEDALFKNFKHPCYSLFVFFERDMTGLERCYGKLYSPNISHSNQTRMHHYCLLFEKEFFEERLKMYPKEPEVYNCRSVRLYGDILGLLNSFALEISRDAPAAETVLASLAEIIAHNVIRGILREDTDGDMPASADYSVAAAQLFMEKHFDEDISVTKLARLGYELVSCFMRRFKKETGTTPMAYLSDVRMRKARGLMKESGLSEEKIAERCGFNSAEKLLGSLGKSSGTAPGQYREAQGNANSDDEKSFT